ncbi:MAG: hypothetical protein ACJ74U_15845 [Jatrophihabitantaceae bacterium]
MAAKIVAAKLLTIGGIALAVATGGVAAAASTGHLPGPLPHSNHASEVAVTAVTSAADPSSTPTASDSPSASDSESESAEPTSAHPSASPSPSLRGLCTSWLARPHLQGKADTNPAFNFLVTTAGGTDAVEAYCTELLASIAPERSGSPSASPGHESGKPSVVPSHSHPSGKPNPLPTPSHPAGR